MCRAAPILLWTAAFLVCSQLEAQRLESNRRDAPATPEPSPGKSTDARRRYADVEEEIVRLTNEFRREHRLRPVMVDSKLQKTAGYFADYMARTYTYGHEVDDKTPSKRAEEHGYKLCMIAENIAYLYNSRGFSTRELGKGFVDGWIKSPEHRANMLDPDMTQTGLAVSRNDRTGYYFAVQLFGRPQSEQIEFHVLNESDRAVEYTIGDTRFELPPLYRRTHVRCRPSKVVLSSQKDDKRDTPIVLTPKKGETYVVTHNRAGEFDVRKR